MTTRPIKQVDRHRNCYRQIGMMAKYWTPGLAKTRLARGSSDVAAALIHRQFTLHLGEQLSLAGDFRYVFTAPDDACEKMQAALGSHWIAVPQGQGDLGIRMQRAFQFLHTAADQSGQTQAILIGADLPTLTCGDMDAVFASLLQNDVVLGPAADGGYYLIGLRGPWRRDYEHLFESIPWSTGDVFSQTRQIIGKLGLTCGHLGVREDVDTVECLHRLQLSDEIDQPLKDSIRSILDQAMNPSQPL